jgi:hypothetical protein
MKPGIKNIKLYREATDKIGLTIRDKVTKTPINLSGATVSGSLYDEYKSFNLSNTDLAVEPLEGKITVTFTPESKNGFTGNKAKWRIKITWPNADVWRIIEGTVELVA